MYGVGRVNQSEFIKPLTNKSNNVSDPVGFLNNKIRLKISCIYAETTLKIYVKLKIC